MPKRWRIATYDPARVAALERAAGIPAVVAQLLIGRGICDGDDARRFLDAKFSGLRDPELLPGAVRAAEMIHEAIRDGRRITVYGDYDADGITATAILLLCLRLLGARRLFPLAEVSATLTPFAVAGLLVLLPTGVLLFSADAAPLLGNRLMQAKLLLVFLGIANALLFRRLWRHRLADWDWRPPAAGRLQAVMSLLCWIAVASLGRLIAYG